MRQTIERMKSARAYGYSPTQFIITEGKKKTFKSYESIIAVNDNGKITLDKYWWEHCTKMTCIYRNKFLGESKEETAKKIASGEYKLKDLNPGSEHKLWT